jgi:hypothetical protein
VVALGKAVRDKFKGFGESNILAGKTGTIIKAAAKVASVVLPRLAKPLLAKMFDTIVNCGITGFEAKFKELTKDTIIDDLIQTVDQIKEKVHEIEADVEAYFKDILEKTFGPIATEFKDFVESAKLVMDVVSMIKDITQAIRIGSCVAGLALAPETVGVGAVVGCGAALGDFILSKFGLSPVDHLIGTILSSCEMQNKLGALMAGLTFIKTLPQRAGAAVVREIKSMLANSETLKNLGSFQNKTYAQHASELFCDPDTMSFPELGYENTNCSDTGSYRESKTGNYDIPKKVPLYEAQTPEPPSEAPWKGVEIPEGRSGEQAPMPKEKGKEPAPADTPPPAEPPKPEPPPTGEKKAEAQAPPTGEGDKAQPPPQQSGGGGTGDGTDGAAGQRTSFTVENRDVGEVTPTPPEFRATFVHGIESGFRTDATGGFDEKTAGGCYAKNVKFSILDTYGMHHDDRHIAIMVCKLEKKADAPYPGAANRLSFRPVEDVSLTVKNDKGETLISYAMKAGRLYGGWLDKRKPD